MPMSVHKLGRAARRQATMGFIPGLPTVLVGDSIVDFVSKDPPSKSMLGYSGGTNLISIAVSGNTIEQQTTAWQACAWRGAGKAKRILVQCGINNTIAGATEAAIEAALETLVGDIITNNPDSDVVVATMLPARTYSGMSAPKEVVREAVNAYIKARVGWNACFAHEDAMDDGTGALKAEFDAVADGGGDHLHPTWRGKIVQAFHWIAKFNTL